MRHNLDEQLAWLGSCQSWEEAFGACLNPAVLQKRAALADPTPALTLVGVWESLWRRAADGKLHGGLVVDKRRPAVRNKAQRNETGFPPVQSCVVDLEDAAEGNGERSFGQAALATPGRAPSAAAPVQVSGRAPSQWLPRLAAPAQPPVQAPVQVPVQAPAQPSAQPPLRAASKRFAEPVAPQAAGGPPSASQSMPSLDSFAFAPSATLLEELQKWRKKCAADRKTKALAILSNKALEAVSETMPTTKADLLSLHGFNKTKVSDFGDELLQLCRGFARPKTRQWPASVAQAAPAPPAPSLSPAAPTQERRPLSAPPETGPKPKKARVDGTRAEVTGGNTVLPTGPIDRSVLTDEQVRAADRALKGESLFITGAAGTGKSFLLRYIIQELEKKCPGEVAITAPTGLAAVNIGGQTIHSFSGIGMLGDKLKEVSHPERYMLSRIKNAESTLSRWRNTRVLVIDEISMLEPDLFEILEFIAREIRGNRSQGFGGMQVLLCGDFLQLPPVDASRDENGRWSFCFETPAWKRCQLQQGTVILQQPVRQLGDPTFVQMLNFVRAGQCTPDVMEICSRCRVSAKPLPTGGIVPTRLYCTNRDVDQENNRKLQALPGKEQVFWSQDHFSGRSGHRSVPTAEKRKLMDLLNRAVAADMRLKPQAQVILLRRLKGHDNLVNGSRGVVVQLHDNGASVQFDNGSLVKVERQRFQYMSANGVGNRDQLPLKLGWALTIHKSQGMSISRAEVHLDEAFSCGQAYVALSRLTGFAGLWIGGRGVSQHNIRAHPKALAFYGLA